MREKCLIIILLCRSGGRVTETIQSRDDYQELYGGDDQDRRLVEDSEALRETLENLLEDLTACDVQVKLTILASPRVDLNNKTVLS